MPGHEPQPQKHHVWGQPTKKGLHPFAQLRFGVSVPCSVAKTSPPAPTLGPIERHLGNSSKLCQAPVGPSLCHSYQLQQQYGIVLDCTNVSWQKHHQGLPWGGDTGLMVPKGLLAHPCPGHTAGTSVAPGIAHPPKPRHFAGQECCHHQ